MRVKTITWLLSFTLAAGFWIAVINHLLDVHSYYNRDSHQLYDQQTLDNYLDAHWHNASTNWPVYIPTGIFIQSLKWIDSTSFSISGYIWQKYPRETNAAISEGFVFPEAISLTAEVAYRYKTANIETVGWLFEATINQRFDYAKYPFDHKTVSIRLWHKDFDQRALLVPDFASYDSTLPDDKFGLDPHIALGGYDILGTYFRYQHTHYDSNFGYTSDGSEKNFPELYYNIVLRRNAADAMIINVLPLLAVIILCFCSLLSNTFDDKKREIYNFRYMEILTHCAALFFVVLLAHIHLREVFAGIGIVYIEYIYVITYLCIIYVTVNAFLVVHAELMDYAIYRIIRYEDNLIPKALFLPIFSAMVLLVSLWLF